MVLREAASVSRPQDAETLTLLDCVGRVLAEPVVADRDQPPFDRSTRDGFAVRASDIASGMPVKVLGLLRAGERWEGAAAGAWCGD